MELTCRQIAKACERFVPLNRQPVLVVSPEIRAGLKQMTEGTLPRLHILSFNEVTRDTKLESLGAVTEIE